MLRFVLVVLILLVILKISQDDPYMGFTVYLSLYVLLMIYMMDRVDCDENEIKKSYRDSLRDGRNFDDYRYYRFINSQ
jgi:hypothetical protein